MTGIRHTGMVRTYYPQQTRQTVSTKSIIVVIGKKDKRTKGQKDKNDVWVSDNGSQL